MVAWGRAVKMERKHSDLRYILQTELIGTTGRLDMEVEGKAEIKKNTQVSGWTK